MGGHVDRMAPAHDDPHEAVSLFARQLDQRVGREVEAVMAVPHRHADELAPGVVDPGVVGAGEPPGVAAPLRRFGSAVAAVVQEGMGGPVLVPGDQH